MREASSPVRTPGPQNPYRRRWNWKDLGVVQFILQFVEELRPFFHELPVKGEDIEAA